MIISAGVPIVVSGIARAIRVPVLWAIRAMGRFRPIGAMVRSAVGARRNYVAMEITRTSASRHRRPPVIFRRPLPPVRVRRVLVLDLLVPRFDVTVVLRNPFAFAFARLNSVRPAVEAYTVEVVHHHRAVVCVVNHGHVDVAHRAIVDELSSAPFSAPETYARVAEAIINAAIETDVRSPVAAVPHVHAFVEAPIPGRPEEAGLRSHHPRSWHPVIALVAVSPIPRRPDITRGRANRLDVHR